MAAEVSTARYSAAKVLGFFWMNSVLVPKAQQGWPFHRSLVSRWMKPTSSNTARWLKGSGPRKPSILPARRLATISAGGTTRSCTSVSGFKPASAR
ncbi:hypothetical protein D3C72_1722120 [compost metagenome]